jgi:prepilin peptidase CpaA
MHVVAPCLQIGLAVVGMALLLVACLYDWALRIVPNAVPSAIAVSGLALRALSGDLVESLLAAGVIFLLAVCCWRRGWLGGADVKLLGAGALLGAPGMACGFVLATCLGGGVLALVYLLVGRLVGPPGPRPAPNAVFRRLLRIEQRRLRRRGPLPYATAIAFGAGVAMIGR